MTTYDRIENGKTLKVKVCQSQFDTKERTGMVDRRYYDENGKLVDCEICVVPEYVLKFFKCHNTEDGVAIGEEGKGIEETVWGDDNADNLVQRMWLWFVEHDVDIDQLEFELNGTLYEANAVYMHYHYAKGRCSYDDMMKAMQMLHIV